MKHTVKLPKNSRRLTIDQADAAMAQMGYRRLSSRFELKTLTSYSTVLTPTGETVEMSADEIKNLVYGK